MQKRLFGTLPDGQEAFLYTITDGTHTAEITSYGARLVSFKCFSRDIVGGFDDLDSYLLETAHHGGIIGRVANRIEDAVFYLDGIEYRLPQNNGKNCLHGGISFDTRMWTVTDCTDSSITLNYLSPDMEAGFPSSLDVYVSYTLKDGALIIDYKATPDGKTPIALTNHAYFNLDGFGKEALNHTLKIYADEYSEVNENLIPNGTHPATKGGKYDFTYMHRVGDFLDESFDGYDRNFVIKAEEYGEFVGKRLALAAVLENSDLRMQVYTDTPGIQLYTANFMNKGPDFRGGIKQIARGAICLEAQTEPNSIRHGVGIYNKGETYTQTTVYKVTRR